MATRARLYSLVTLVALLLAVAGFMALLSGGAKPASPTATPSPGNTFTSTAEDASAATATAAVRAAHTAVSSQTAAAHAGPSPTLGPARAEAQRAQVEALQRDSKIALSSLPYAWPLPPFDDGQIRNATACDIPTLYEDRYEDVPEEDLLAAGPPHTACDWAALAAALAYRASQAEPTRPVSEAGRIAYQTAVSANPALASKSWLLYGDFGPGSLVEAPPFTRQPVRSVLLTYSFSGIGYRGETNVIISHADTGQPLIDGQIYESDAYVAPNETPQPPYRPPNRDIDPALVQALGASLTDLIPIDHQFEVTVCDDYYPYWQVMIVYADGTSISLSTDGSNMLSGGGPWQVAIDGQDYMHVSSAIPSAVDALARQLGIPGGTTAAMVCGGSDDLTLFAFAPR